MSKYDILASKNMLFMLAGGSGGCKVGERELSVYMFEIPQLSRLQSIPTHFTSSSENLRKAKYFLFGYTRLFDFLFLSIATATTHTHKVWKLFLLCETVSSFP